MKQVISKLFSRVAAVAAVALLTAATAWGQTTVSYGWETADDATQWIISDAIVATDGQGNTGSYAGKINTNHTYVQFKEKVYVTAFSFAFKRTSSNNNYNVYIETSTDGSTWTAVETFAMSSFGNGTYTTKAHTFDGTHEYYVRFHCYNTTAVRYVDDVTITYTAGPSVPPPSISADNVEIAYNATAGSIAYSIDNSVEGGVVSAAVTEGDWLTLGNGTASPIAFTCSAYAGIAPRTATVVLTYTYNTNLKVTKAVTVTQAADPNAVNSISDITASGDYTVKGTIVAKSQRGFIVGDGTGYVYYYNQDYAQSDYSIGNKVKVSGDVSVRGGVFEYTSSATITAASESGYAVEEPTVLTGANMDSRVASATPAQLSSFVQYEGILSVSGSYYNITSIDGATTAKGSISYPLNTEFTSLSGKKVKVTGYYVGISSSQYYNTMIGSIEEIVVPAINAASSVELEYDATSGEIEYSIGNPVSGVTLAATTTADWISNINVTSNKVTFSTTANDGTADRSATITLTYTGADNKNVTVTQKHYVAEFAELPFEFDGGKEALANTGGMSQNGLGGDYGSSPKLKFDSTGDWVILKFDERPGTLSYDIKGNGFSGGVFTVQTSADGETFTDLKEYSEIGDTQNEEISDLAADVRFIKWIYTRKSSGNVALGNIALDEYVAPDPSITITPEFVEHEATDEEGTLSIAYEAISISDMDDFDIEFYEEVGGNTMGRPDWIMVEIAEQDPSVGEGFVVSYVMDENTGATRSAFFRVYALDDEANEVYSNFVTITQAAPVVDYATLPFEFDGGKADVETTNGLTQDGLDSDYGSSPKLKFSSTDDWLILKMNEAPGKLTFDIKGNGFSGGTFTVQTSADGVAYTDLATYTELGATQSEEFGDLPETVRYIKWIYTEKSTGNVALGNIKLSRKASTHDTYELSLAAGDGGYWGTFYNGGAMYVLPEGAQAFTMNADKKLFRLGGSNDKGRYIPAGTAVVIISDVSAVTLTKGNYAEEITVNGGENILQGDDFPVEVDGNQYVLGKKNGVVGFYKFLGADIPENKAFYVISE